MMEVEEVSGENGKPESPVIPEREEQVKLLKLSGDHATNAGLDFFRSPQIG
jgi:hypothetical protein